jgi:BAI1-associated protein 3
LIDCSLNLPKAAVMMEGAVLVCSVWHHDRILPNDFLGETVTRLSDVIDLDQRHISDTPAIIMPLRRPRDSCWGPMQVLRERQGMDQQARHVTTRRCHMTGVNVTSKVCAPLTHVISKVKGKKEIVGTNRIMGMLDTPDEHFSTIEYFDGTLA